MLRLGIALSALLVAGCDCACDGCGCDALATFAYPDRDAITTAAVPYLHSRPEVAARVGAVQSVEREETVGLPTIASGTVGETEARRIRMVVRGANGSLSADVVLVQRDGAWVAVGATLLEAAAATPVGDPVTFVERASGDGWD